MSTCVRMQLTHMLVGLGAMAVPHRQHSLRTQQGGEGAEQRWGSGGSQLARGSCWELAVYVAASIGCSVTCNPASWRCRAANNRQAPGLRGLPPACGRRRRCRRPPQGRQRGSKRCHPHVQCSPHPGSGPCWPQGTHTWPCVWCGTKVWAPATGANMAGSMAPEGSCWALPRPVSSRSSGGGGCWRGEGCWRAASA